MPRTNAQAKRKSPAPAPTPTHATSRRRAPHAQHETPSQTISGPDVHQGPPTILQLDLQLGWRSLVNSLLGAAVGSGALYGIGWIYLKLRKVEGMGLGDVKLMAMAGAFLGPLLTLFVLCTASLLGGIYGIYLLIAVFGKRLARYHARLGRQAGARAWRAANLALHGMEIPFGVFLCVMSIVAWFYGVAVIRGYLRLFLIPG